MTHIGSEVTEILEEFVEMPIYEYQCTACSHQLEALQKLSEEPLIYCPECGEGSLKKMVSAAAFRLKGSGWYETDFKHNDKKDDSKKTPGSSADSNGKAPAADDGNKTASKSADSKPVKSKETSSSSSAGSAGS